MNTHNLVWIVGWVASFFVGAIAATLVLVSDKLEVHQSGYAEGVRATLDKMVQVGGDGTPCAIEIPLGVLADVVRIGVLDWHQECLRAIEEAKK